MPDRKDYLELERTESNEELKTKYQFGDIEVVERHKKESSPPGCWGRLNKRFFPCGYLPAFKETMSLAVPLFVSEILRILLGNICLVFCGHLGRIQLDSVALAISVINITCISIAEGLGTACDTLFAQTFGSNNKRLMGIYLQRSLVMLPLPSLLCMAIHINCENFLILLGQDRAIAAMAGNYLMYYLPGTVAVFLYQVFSRFVQTQNIVYPSLIIGIIANLFNALLHYILIYQVGMGIEGSAIALTSSTCLMTVLMVAYVLISGVYKDYWYGWTSELWLDWGTYTKLAIPGMFMICLEWWSFEVGIFVAGNLGPVELGSQSILFNLASLIYMLPLGFSIAASIRVGHALGAGNALEAKTAANVVFTIVAVTSTLVAVGLTALQWQLPRIFTQDPEIIAMTASILPIMAAYVLFDSTVCVGAGTLRGCGRQLLCAVVIFISYYVIALPIGIPLMFFTPLGLTGLWVPLASVLAVHATIYVIIITFTNWDKQVERALERTKDSLADDPDETTGLLSGTDTAVSDDEYGKPYLRYYGRYTSQLSDVGDVPETPTSHDKYLVCKRLLLISAMVGLFAGGVVIKLLVHVPYPMSPLCIAFPVNGSLPVNNTGLNLPYCNETMVPAALY